MDTTTLFDEWFRIADKDRDGRIAGGEAVEFFGRSGLNKNTLFQVRGSFLMCCRHMCA